MKPSSFSRTEVHVASGARIPRDAHTCASDAGEGPEGKDLLRRQGVQALYSPEGTPKYNGAVEAGIGSIKVRTFWHAALDDRPGDWTCDDVEAAMHQANETGRPHGPLAPTPQTAWQWRRPITEAERARFAETSARYAAEEYTRRGLLPMMGLQHR